MKEEFKNYRELDLNLTIPDSSSMSSLIDHLYNKLGKAETKVDYDHKNKKKKENILKVIIVNLYNNYSIDKTRYTGIYRSSNRYDSTSMYNSHGISRQLPEVVKDLSGLGYLEYDNGVNSSNPRASPSYISRNILTDKLLYLFKKYKIDADHIELLPETESIIIQIKDENGKRKIEYEESDNIKKYRAILTRYNNLLRETDIDVNELPNKRGIVIGKSLNPVAITKKEKFVRKIFNHEHRHLGGRYYGGWWQRINSKWRNQIMINQSPTIELDYTAIHLRILYDWKNLKQLKGDPYDLRQVQYTEPYKKYTEEEVRPVLKMLLLIMLNAKSKAKAIRAFRLEINDTDNNHPKDLDINTLVEKFTQMHYQIDELGLFYTGVGQQLARYDSEITTLIIDHFTKQKIPILTVHDSYIIQTQHLRELEKVMDTEYQKVLENTSTVKLKIPFINKYLQGWDDIKKPYSYSAGRKANPLSAIVVPDHIGKGQEVIMKQVPKDMDLQRRHQDYLKWFIGATKDYYKTH